VKLIAEEVDLHAKKNQSISIGFSQIILSTKLMLKSHDKYSECEGITEKRIFCIYSEQTRI
jgi:hypothetical protein